MHSKQYRHIDPGGLLDSVGGDREALACLAQTYLDTAPAIFTALQQAAATGNAANVRHESHALKSMSALIGATTLSDMLQQVERDAQGGQLPAAPQRQALALQLELACDELASCIRDHGRD